jgi:hypothetical protein
MQIATFMLLVLIRPAAAAPTRLPDLPPIQIFPDDNTITINLGIDRNYQRCSTVLVQAEACFNFPQELNDATRSVMLPDGAGCTMYKNVGCDNRNDRFRAWRGKSVADLRDCGMFGCMNGQELALSSVRCRFKESS